MEEEAPQHNIVIATNITHPPNSIGSMIIITNKKPIKDIMLTMKHILVKSFKILILLYKDHSGHYSGFHS
jgi:hypothetical protein